MLSAATRVISDTGKYDRAFSQLLHEKLRSMLDRVTFKLVVTVHRCLNGRAPQYLAVHCVPLSALSVTWTAPLQLRYAACGAIQVLYAFATVQPETSPFGWAKSTARTTSPTQHVRPPPGFCHCWAVRLEQSSGPCPQSELNQSCFQAPAKGNCVRTVLARLGVGVVACDALCKFTYWQWLQNDNKISLYV